MSQDFLEKLYEEEGVNALTKQAAARQVMDQFSVEELEYMLGLPKTAKAEDTIQQTHRTGFTPISPRMGAVKGGTMGALSGALLGGAAGAEGRLGGSGGWKGALMGAGAGALGVGALGAAGGAGVSAIKRTQIRSDAKQIKKIREEMKKKGCASLLEYRLLKVASPWTEGEAAADKKHSSESSREMLSNRFRGEQNKEDDKKEKESEGGGDANDTREKVAQPGWAFPLVRDMGRTALKGSHGALKATIRGGGAATKFLGKNIGRAAGVATSKPVLVGAAMGAAKAKEGRRVEGALRGGAVGGTTAAGMGVGGAVGGAGGVVAGMSIGAAVGGALGGGDGAKGGAFLGGLLGGLTGLGTGAAVGGKMGYNIGKEQFWDSGTQKKASFQAADAAGRVMAKAAAARY